MAVGVGGLTSDCNSWGGVIKSGLWGEGQSRYPWPFPLQLWQIMLLVKLACLGDGEVDGEAGAACEAVDLPNNVSICDMEDFKSLSSSWSLTTDGLVSLATAAAFQMEGSCDLGYSKLTLWALLVQDLPRPVRDRLS